MPEDLPTPNLHTPEELLATAESLLAAMDPALHRAVVLEAITALEAFVHQTVFRALVGKLDPLLVKWLEDKTLMDFDSRLSVIAPIATGQPVETGSQLWRDYKVAKKTRNKVTHEGRRVSREEAIFVLETVRRWLAHLGSTASVEIALDGLKRYVESHRLQVGKGNEAERVVFDYFGRTRPATAARQMSSPKAKYDLVLRFGEELVAVEVKRTPRRLGDLENFLLSAARQVTEAIRGEKFSRGAVICFSPMMPTEAFQKVRTLENGVISLVVIRVPDLDVPASGLGNI